MEHLQGPLRKMIATAESPVSYRLPIGAVELPLNACLGKTMYLDYAGAITCIACGQRTTKSFQQGYCFRCVRTLARATSAWSNRNSAILPTAPAANQRRDLPTVCSRIMSTSPIPRG